MHTIADAQLGFVVGGCRQQQQMPQQPQQAPQQAGPQQAAPPQTGAAPGGFDLSSLLQNPGIQQILGGIQQLLAQCTGGAQQAAPQQQPQG